MGAIALSVSAAPIISAVNGNKVPVHKMSLFLLFCVWCPTDSLLCRNCGHEVTNAEHIVKVPSVLSKQVRNDTILGVPGVLIQLFENPQGMCDWLSMRLIGLDLSK